MFAQVGYKLLVAITLGPAQMEIAMDGMDTVAELQQYKQQRSTVSSTAHTRYNLGSVMQETVLGDVSAYFFFKSVIHYGFKGKELFHLCIEVVLYN